MEMVEWKALENLRRDLILSEKVYKTGNQDIQSIRSSALIKER